MHWINFRSCWIFYLLNSCCNLRFYTFWNIKTWTNESNITAITYIIVTHFCKLRFWFWHILLIHADFVGRIHISTYNYPWENPIFLNLHLAICLSMSIFNSHGNNVFLNGTEFYYWNGKSIGIQSEYGE